MSSDVKGQQYFSVKVGLLGPQPRLRMNLLNLFSFAKLQKNIELG
jgi:hypothetical protein